MFKGFGVLRILGVWRVLRGLEGFRGSGAGKRQAWTPRRSH